MHMLTLKGGPAGAAPVPSLREYEINLSGSCLRPLEVAGVRGDGSAFVTLRRCGFCADCVEVRTRALARVWKPRLQKEIEAAITCYWVTLTSGPTVQEPALLSGAFKQCLRRLRTGRVTCAAFHPDYVDQASGAPRLNKRYYMFAGLPEAGGHVPRTAEGRAEAGYIPGDPLLRYIYVIEKAPEGTGQELLHVHAVLLTDERLVPPGAIWPAWEIGFVKVRPVGDSPADAEKVAHYLAKYCAKAKVDLRTAAPASEAGYRYFRTSQGFGLSEDVE